MNPVKTVVARARYSTCPAIQHRRLVRTRNRGASLLRFGRSPKSSSRQRDMSSMEFESPKVQMNGSNICNNVSCSPAKSTTFPDSRKQAIKPRLKPSQICGLLGQRLKFTIAVMSICRSLSTLKPPL